MLDVIWDMETSDPDDFITLLLLLGHPEVRLKAVTLTPGSTSQVGLVRRALSWFGANIPVGANNIAHPKECVSSWHERAFGKSEPSNDAEPGGELLHRLCDEHTTLITGAPLKNLGAAMKLPNFKLGRLVAQGGFAGEGVVPPEKQLPKFRGLRICPTFNLNGDPRSALASLVHPGIGERRFVSKNVCHGVVYNADFHQRLEPLKEGSRSLERIWHGMDVYLDHKHGRAGTDEGAKLTESFDPEGKKFHDPLAACCAIDPSLATWAEVEIFREKGQWGSKLKPGTNTWIITDYQPERFFSVLTRTKKETPKA
jgi:pyrimidine-specific ribonucleoside hydrolase